MHALPEFRLREKVIIGEYRKHQDVIKYCKCESKTECMSLNLIQIPWSYSVNFVYKSSTCSLHKSPPPVNTLAWLGTNHLILQTQPLKMELREGSETSANHNLTPGKYPNNTYNI
jgi:hypothetical protein